jgi:hypothetical protein
LLALLYLPARAPKSVQAQSSVESTTQKGERRGEGMHLDKNGLNPLKRKREVEKYRKKDETETERGEKKEDRNQMRGLDEEDET